MFGISSEGGTPITDPGVDTLADWTGEALEEILPLLGERMPSSSIDLVAAAVADRLHGEVWPGCSSH